MYTIAIMIVAVNFVEWEAMSYGYEVTFFQEDLHYFYASMVHVFNHYCVPPSAMVCMYNHVV